MKYYKNFKECLSILIYIKISFIYVIKATFSASSLQCMILQKSFYYADLLFISEKVVLLIFYSYIYIYILETMILFCSISFLNAQLNTSIVPGNKALFVLLVYYVYL